MDSLRRRLTSAVLEWTASLPGDLRALVEAGFLDPIPPRGLATLMATITTEGLHAGLLPLAHSLRDPEGVAVRDGRTARRWAAFESRVRGLRAYMREAGVEPGTSLAIALSNRIEFVEAAMAGLAAGARVMLVSPHLPKQELKAAVERLEPALSVVEQGTSLPGRTLHVGREFAAAARTDRRVREPLVSRFRPAGEFVVFTSGTTGSPKAAVRGLRSNAAPASLFGFLQTVPLGRGDRFIAATPLYHVSGFGLTLIAQVLGAQTILLPRFKPEAFLRAVERDRATAALVVPTMLYDIVRHPRAKRFDLSSMRALITTGAPLTPEVERAAAELFGDVIFDLYGSAEMGWVSVSSPQDRKSKPGTVGRPLPHIHVRIQDGRGREVKPGRVGRIAVRSGVGMDGYLGSSGRPEWISGGDRGKLDDEGYLFVAGRTDDLIVSGGVNVDPSTVEEPLRAHPAVDDAAVFGIPDQRWGTKVAAAVVTSSDVTEADLIAWCKERLPPPAVPKEIRFLERLPRGNIGKLDRKALQREHARETRAAG